MTTKLSVTVAVDMDFAAVTLRLAGKLTSENVQGLLAVVRRAERDLPGVDLQLDLAHLQTGSPEAFRTLSDSGVRTHPRHHQSSGHHGFRLGPDSRAAA
jgi:hypothetical protein